MTKMIKELVLHMKTKGGQITNLFDLSSEDVEVFTHKNLISCDALRGEYTISGAQENKQFSIGSLNGTHDFRGKDIVTQTFFGEQKESHPMKARKIQAGYAFRREVAIEGIADPKVGNSIVAYLGAARADLGKEGQYMEKNSKSQSQITKISYTLGVLFKASAEQIESLSITELEKLYVNIAIGAKTERSTMTRFLAINDRFMAGSSYIVDVGIGYTDSIFMDREFIESLQHYKPTLGELKLK